MEATCGKLQTRAHAGKRCTQHEGEENDCVGAHAAKHDPCCFSKGVKKTKPTHSAVKRKAGVKKEE
jgi:hypothetical protein